MGGLGAVRRRDLLQAIGAAWLVDQVLPDQPPIVGRVMGASHRVGHLLRDATPAGAAVDAGSTDVAVVGSGVSGLSAAWRLRELGVKVTTLELESFVGGTSSWGEAGVVPHPWGAHYLPVPEPGARATLRLLAQLGVIEGWDQAGRPRFDPRLLCHAPEERVFYRGRWHKNLVPRAALPAGDGRDMDRFRALQLKLRDTKGRDGRYAFALPTEQSSRDPELLALDRMSMAQWLDEQGLHGEFVRWYVQYATLDDYGASLEDTSAWAGLHYFCSRRLDSEQLAGSRFLVWPEGNGFLVKGLVRQAQPERRQGALVLSVRPLPKGGVAIDYLDVERRELRRLRAKAAVVATPAFIARRLLAAGNASAAAARLPERASSPWVVSNLHVRRQHYQPNHAWDSVIYGSKGLGYVDAGHQRMRPERRTVLTHFRAFGARDVRATRQRLVGMSWSEHASEVLLDMAPAEPHLARETERIDVMVWGHAMPRPRPGFLGARPFDVTPRLAPGIAWAHVDQTGIALFEEANMRGVRAAEALADDLGVPIGESWA
jgi:hypothetical protein